MKREKGMVIVEATLVFPIMFLVLFFLIFMGNAYYQKCRVEAIVTELTLAGAAYCADPLLPNVAQTGDAPGYNDDNDPWRYYRYFTRMDYAKAEIEEKLTERLGNVSTGLFSGMRPTKSFMEAKPNNYVIYATFGIELEYKVPIPVKLLGQEYFSSFVVECRAESAVTDVPEFMRNVNMVEDYLEQTKAMETIRNAIGKAKDFFKK